MVMVIAGLIIHLLLCLVLRKPITSAWGLLAPLFLGMWLESYEIWVHYKNTGLFASGNDPLSVIIFRHSTDVLNVMSLPLVLVVLGKFGINFGVCIR